MVKSEETNHIKEDNSVCSSKIDYTSFKSYFDENCKGKKSCTFKNEIFE